MSDTYFSWKTDAGLMDAGKVGPWSRVRAWVKTLPPTGSGLLRDLAQGGDVVADDLEAELAPAFAKLLREKGDGVDEELRQGLEDLLSLLIARKPGQRTLVPREGDEEDFEQPHLLDWVVPAKEQIAKGPAKRRERVSLLLTLQQVLDTEADDEDMPDRQVRLLACLELLPEFPPA